MSNWKDSPGEGRKHYDVNGGIQPIEYSAYNYPDSSSANVWKYVFRHDRKAGKVDLEKGLWYIEWLRNIYVYRAVEAVAAGDFIASNPHLDEHQKEILLLLEELAENNPKVYGYDATDTVKNQKIIDKIEHHIQQMIEKYYG